MRPGVQDNLIDRHLTGMSHQLSKGINMQTMTSPAFASRSSTGETKPLTGGILIKPSQFSRITPIPAWKGTIAHIYARLARFIGDYRHYREKGFRLKAAWYLASMTLP